MAGMVGCYQAISPATFYRWRAAPSQNHPKMRVPHPSRFEAVTKPRRNAERWDKTRVSREAAA